jgi:hypothetical protein
MSRTAGQQLTLASAAKVKSGFFFQKLRRFGVARFPLSFVRPAQNSPRGRRRH